MHDGIQNDGAHIYFFVIIEVQGPSFLWYNYEYDSTHTFFLLLLKFKDSHFDPEEN